MKSHHLINLDVNWATPALLMAGASVFILIIQKVFANYLMRWGFTMASQEIKVDEDLPNFFKSVRLT
jgi:hypothetical protein